MLTPILIASVIGYLLGSLPFGYLVARAKGVNIFEVGSKNTLLDGALTLNLAAFYYDYEGYQVSQIIDR